MPLPKSLSDFAGPWQIRRQIRDTRGPDGTFAGLATLRPDADGLIYSEQGTLCLGPTQFQAERSYLWRAETEDTITLYFPDNRLFHSFRLIPNPTALHDCPPDTYQVSYEFTRWPHWTSTWRVTGPRKDYVMTSHYAPA